MKMKIIGFIVIMALLMMICDAQTAMGIIVWTALILAMVFSGYDHKHNHRR